MRARFWGVTDACGKRAEPPIPARPARVLDRPFLRQRGASRKPRQRQPGAQAVFELEAIQVKLPNLPQ
jgi:hypothetical protein